jgi:hypothetical protein
MFAAKTRTGRQFILAQPVYSLNLANEIFEESPEMKNVYYHRYKIVNIENTDKRIKDFQTYRLACRRNKKSIAFIL